MSATVSSFNISNARLHFFASKEDYLAYKAAWKTLTNSGLKLSSSLFAAHAILNGRDLYKAFSPNRRPHAEKTPYAALTNALVMLRYELADLTAGKRADVAKRLTPEQLASLTAGLAAADGALKSLNLSLYSTQQAISTGAGVFNLATAEV